ncbi:hypothetical protein ATANTOWER_003954, partial [Ataeniobius toweri]|nr:hypothetical protein [Ataeniobius toweri]
SKRRKCCITSCVYSFLHKTDVTRRDQVKRGNKNCRQHLPTALLQPLWPGYPRMEKVEESLLILIVLF